MDKSSLTLFIALSFEVSLVPLVTNFTKQKDFNLFIESIAFL